ncbi:heme ABC exporter ATP-binding protein CcmA [Sphingomonas sp. ASV193]|uniref:heme ABC exporter ATP-binding protein CcmA n=1 Tax=Sphingomonas sp. ASV193 TaxID=3144405 RepID=UPI0032E8B070
MSLLTLDRVSIVRGGRLLVEELSLALEAGGAVHLAGPNGVGKSSLIRAIAGLLRPASGTIERADAALADDALALDRELPLGKALAFWGGAALAEAIEAFALDGLVEVPVRMLSTGQAKRARLARVMASGAPLWLLDEPLNGLDRDGGDRLASVVAGHRARGGAVVAASHVALPGAWRTVEIGG